MLPKGADTLGQTLLTRKHFLVAGLSFCTGAANVVSLMIYDAFGTVLTGNTIACVRAFIDGRSNDGAFYASVVATYWVGAFVSKVLAHQKWRATAISPFAFVLFGLCSLARRLSESRYTIILFSTGIGLVNTLTATLDGVVTQMITGHWTTIAGETLLLLRKGKQLPRQDAVKLLVSVGVVFW